MEVSSAVDGVGLSEAEVEDMERAYIDIERNDNLERVEVESIDQLEEERGPDTPVKKLSIKEKDQMLGRVVDVVLSDMSEPFPQTTGFYKKSLSDPYFRMMNTSGIAFKDHVGSIVSFRWLQSH